MKCIDLVSLKEGGSSCYVCIGDVSITTSNACTIVIGDEALKVTFDYVVTNARLKVSNVAIYSNGVEVKNYSFGISVESSDGQRSVYLTYESFKEGVEVPLPKGAKGITFSITTQLLNVIVKRLTLHYKVSVYTGIYKVVVEDGNVVSVEALGPSERGLKQVVIEEVEGYNAFEVNGKTYVIQGTNAIIPLEGSIEIPNVINVDKVASFIPLPINDYTVGIAPLGLLLDNDLNVKVKAYVEGNVEELDNVDVRDGLYVIDLSPLKGKAILQLSVEINGKSYVLFPLHLGLLREVQVLEVKDVNKVESVVGNVTDVETLKVAKVLYGVKDGKPVWYDTLVLLREDVEGDVEKYFNISGITIDNGVVTNVTLPIEITPKEGVNVNKLIIAYFDKDENDVKVVDYTNNDKVTLNAYLVGLYAEVEVLVDEGSYESVKVGAPFVYNPDSLVEVDNVNNELSSDVIDFYPSPSLQASNAFILFNKVPITDKVVYVDNNVLKPLDQCVTVSAPLNVSSCVDVVLPLRLNDVILYVRGNEDLVEALLPILNDSLSVSVDAIYYGNEYVGFFKKDVSLSSVVTLPKLEIGDNTIKVEGTNTKIKVTPIGAQEVEFNNYVTYQDILNKIVPSVKYVPSTMLVTLLYNDKIVDSKLIDVFNDVSVSINGNVLTILNLPSFSGAWSVKYVDSNGNVVNAPSIGTNTYDIDHATVALVTLAPGSNFYVYKAMSTSSCVVEDFDVNEHFTINDNTITLVSLPSWLSANKAFDVYFIDDEGNVANVVSNATQFKPDGPGLYVIHVKGSACGQSVVIPTLLVVYGLDVTFTKDYVRVRGLESKLIEVYEKTSPSLSWSKVKEGVYVTYERTPTQYYGLKVIVDGEVVFEKEGFIL